MSSLFGIGANGASSFYNGVATQSLRFDIGSSAYLTRTPSSAGNRKTYTASFWLKPSKATLNSAFLAGRTGSSGTYTVLGFSASDNRIRIVDNQTTYPALETSGKYRDVSAWYHMVFAVDTTQATSSNRLKIYVNGEEQSYAASNYYSQNADTNINSTAEHYIGSNAGVANLDGYLAEYNFIDGQQLDPTSFGETKNGVWIAKEYTGSYGTNGFRLQFNQTGTGTGSSSTIGADTSGNNNHWTSSGIVASDCDMPDSPENRFATFNSVFKTSTSIIAWGNNSITLSEGSLRADLNTGNEVQSGALSTFLVPTSGKWYWEIFCIAEASGSISGVGVIEQATGTYIRSSSNTSGRTYGANDIINVAFDADNNRIYFGINGTFPADQTPTDASDGTSATGSDYLPYVWGNHAGSPNQFCANFGQDSTFAGATTAGGNIDANGIGDFKYSVPSGYLALCTANLPEPTISPNADTQADDYFNTVLYTGSGSSPNSITGIGFQPDWVWIKKRTANISHAIFDSVRGVTASGATNKAIGSDRVDAEGNGNGGLSSFDSDGFTLVDGSSGSFPRSLVNDATTYVSWNWKAGGTAVSNTDGSITSSVSANTDAGFSIVTYTGTGSGATVGHGVGKELDFIIIKRRSDSSTWAVYSRELGSGKKLELNGTSGTITNAQFFTANPTSSVFSLGTEYDVNGSGGTFVAYCFAEIESYSKFGSYTGNGSTDGTFVYTGFRPAFLLYKRTDSTGNWLIDDNKTSTYNYDSNYLIADGSDAEGDTTTNTAGHMFDHLSNGFKMRNTNSARNASGGTFIYMAFAENPFKYANAR